MGEKTLKVEKFRILQNVKEFVDSADKYLVNFPHKEIELKRKLMDTAYELVYTTHLANTIKDFAKRKELQEVGIAQIKMLDFYIELCFEKKIINQKKYLRFGESLECILRYYQGWFNTTEQMISQNKRV